MNFIRKLLNKFKKAKLIELEEPELKIIANKKYNSRYYDNGWKKDIWDNRCKVKE